MPKPLNSTPKEGDYYTGVDADSETLPKPRPFTNARDPIEHFRNAAKFKQSIWQRQALRKAQESQHNSTDAADPLLPPKPRDSMQPAMRAYRTRLKNSIATEKSNDKLENEALAAAIAKQMKDEYAMLPPYLRPFLSPSLKRAEGRPATIWTLKLTTDRGGKVQKKYQDYHVIICWYQFLVGALGKSIF